MEILAYCVTDAIIQADVKDPNVCYDVYNSEKFLQLLVKVSFVSHLDHATSQCIKELQFNQKQSDEKDLAKVNGKIKRLSKYREDMLERMWNTVKVFVVIFCRGLQGNIIYT
jgi:hypothetical protein